MVGKNWIRASANSVAFLHGIFDQVLAQVKVGLVRADSGFCPDAIISDLEAHGLPCITATKAYSNVTGFTG